MKKAFIFLLMAMIARVSSGGNTPSPCISCDSLQMKEGKAWLNGQPYTGKCETYHATASREGKPVIRESYFYKNGLRYGNFFTLDEKGNITQEGNITSVVKKTEEGEIVIRTGNSVTYEYYESGKMKSETKYIYSDEGIKTISSTAWYETGKVKSTTTYNKFGNQEKYETFRPNGDKELLLIFEYTENQRNKYFTEYKWDEDGNKTVEKGCYSPKF
ncbi:MAG: hypothetical protein ACOZCO_08305 [Bacteroidota bacterium]